MTDEAISENALKPLLKIKEAARRLNISPSNLYNLIKTGEFPSIQIGKKSIRIYEPDLENYILKSRRVEKHVFPLGAKINE